MTDEERRDMSDDERRERFQAIAQIVDDFIDENDRFCLVVFSKDTPSAGERTRFDVISSHPDREHVAIVLQHVVDGIEEDLDRPLPDPQQPN